MGATKMHLYKDHQIEMAKLCKALGHPARIAIVEKLIEEDNLNCTDLRYYIPLAQSTISRHLKELHEVNILGFKVVGNNSFYHINTETVQQVVDYLTHIRISTRQPTNYDMVYFKPKIKHNLPYSMRN